MCLEQEQVRELLSVDKDTFHALWVDNLVFCNDPIHPLNRSKWIVIYLLFYDFREFSEKSRNIWYNEIREIALFNLFCISDRSEFETKMLTVFTEEFEVIASSLIELHDKWIGTLLDCATRSNGDNRDFEVVSLEKKGGQKFPYDFELIIKDLKTQQQKPVKIEFKFSNSGNISVAQLAEFAALNTESENGLKIFRGKSYLDFFWDEGYLARIVTGLDIQEQVKWDSFTQPQWKKTAKSVSPPKKETDPTFALHTFLRTPDVTKNDRKKAIVNESFDRFIGEWIHKIHTTESEKASYFDEISQIFNSKQNDKFFCIFSGRNFNVDSIPIIKINSVVQESDHAFYFKCDGTTGIHCGMSWGNGGAANQNPRMLFGIKEGEGAYAGDEGAFAGDEGPSALIKAPRAVKKAAANARKAAAPPLDVEEAPPLDVEEAPPSFKKGSRAKKTGSLGGSGGQNEDIDSDLSWFIIDEELAKDDTEGQEEFHELQSIVTNKDEERQVIEKNYMTLRSGLKYYTGRGGKKSTKKTRKTTKKTRKSTKKTRKTTQKNRKTTKKRRK
jgi:hypothetical protein